MSDDKKCKCTFEDEEAYLGRPITDDDLDDEPLTAVYESSYTDYETAEVISKYRCMICKGYWKLELPLLWGMR